MKNILYLLLCLVFHAQLRAQDENTRPAGGNDSSAIRREILETGYLLTAIGKYEDAHAYFAYLLRDTPGIQVYNNAGTVAILDALHYFRRSEPEVKFHYPVELDLMSTATRDLKDFTDLRTKKLREAIDHFNAAIQMDSTYAPAYLNKACAYSLLGDVKQADSLAEVAAELPGYEKTALDVLVLKGILYDRLADSLRALEAFKAAADQGSPLAAYNLNILLGQPVETPEPSLRLGSEETIDGLSTIDPYNIPEPDPQSEVALNEQIYFYHNQHPGPNSLFYYNSNAATGQITYFLLTGPNYVGETAEKIKISASVDEVKAAYKEPRRTVETLTGELLVYPSVIFYLGKDRRMVQWALYGQTE